MRALNPLEKEFSLSIRARGPLSVAAWFRDCLTHPEHGYYQKQKVFGAHGDFVTSVEFSAMFCAMLGVWTRHSWRELGSPKSFSLCEFGPGRGALMQSLIESIQKDKEMGHVDVKIHLLENSRQMQKMQAERIPLPVVHHSNISDFATNVGTDPVIILAHEYFDALPIFRFQYKPGVGWCEEMIDIAPELDTRTVIGTSRRAKKAKSEPLEEQEASHAAPEQQKQERHPFRFVLSPGPTPAAIVCLGPDPPSTPKRLEVSPDVQSSMQVIAETIAKNSGLALVIDYGQFGPASDSLRAIRDHKFVHLFESAGECDLSADVDFRMLSNVGKQRGIHVSSCLTQREFLTRMGIQMLLMQMLENGALSEEKSDVIIDEYNRIVDDMGTVYKAMVFGSEERLVKDYQ